MLLKRKGWLRKEFDEKLLNQLIDLKNERNNQNALIEKSFDPSQEVLWEAKLVEAKYFFLLKEAKKRKIAIR